VKEKKKKAHDRIS